LEEIEQNGFNLNISRYVDTSEQEAEIDIQTVMQNISELEAKRADLDTKIEGYLRELGLIK
jgi:type I restriction enzyme M protein